MDRTMNIALKGVAKRLIFAAATAVTTMATPDRPIPARTMRDRQSHSASGLTNAKVVMDMGGIAATGEAGIGRGSGADAC
jgi:hypothetical protein